MICEATTFESWKETYGIVIWEDAGYGKLEIKFTAGKLNNRKYIEMIDEQINTRATRIVEN